MKVLLDTCIWGGAAKDLQAAGHDVHWAGDDPKDPGDDALLQRAHQEGRVLFTLDKDFGELAIVHLRPHAGLVRLVGLRARQQGPAMVAVLAKYESELQGGAILTVEDTRVRIRPGI
ncbi:MAG: DUF5615 family PIN-like protein [Planctomycetes bacterium]|nr:DUF5615 family PIN-like protein [Planctomycetota bacterium]